MAKRKKPVKRRGKVGASDNTVLLLGGLALAGVALFVFMKPSTTPTTIIRTVPSGSSSASSTAATVAEIAAGGAAITSIINSFTDDNS